MTNCHRLDTCSTDSGRWASSVSPACEKFVMATSPSGKVVCRRPRSRARPTPRPLSGMWMPLDRAFRWTVPKTDRLDVPRRSCSATLGRSTLGYPTRPNEVHGHQPGTVRDSAQLACSEHRLIASDPEFLILLTDCELWKYLHRGVNWVADMRGPKPAFALRRRRHRPLIQLHRTGPDFSTARELSCKVGARVRYLLCPLLMGS